MKYIKLFENFEERKPISDKNWSLFEAVNKKFRRRLWDRKYLIDNGDGTFDYNADYPLKFERLKVLTCEDFIPVQIRNITEWFQLEIIRLQSLKGAPKEVDKVVFSSLNNLLCLKYCPKSRDGLALNGNGQEILLSDVNDYGYKLSNWDWEKPNIKNIRRYLDSDIFNLSIWYESLAFVGARDPKAYTQVCSDFPEETKFIQEQVEEIYKSDLIDYESTLVDAVVVGLPVPIEVMDRTKKYDHSEYRDSKLDSEWKDVF